MNRRRWAAPLPGGSRPETQHIHLYPNPLSPPAPPEPVLTRDENLARVQTGFSSLDETELSVALLWLTGSTFDDVCERVGLPEKAVRSAWQQMRRKLRDAVKVTPGFDT